MWSLHRHTRCHKLRLIHVILLGKRWPVSNVRRVKLTYNCLLLHKRTMRALALTFWPGDRATGSRTCDRDAFIGFFHLHRRLMVLDLRVGKLHILLLQAKSRCGSVAKDIISMSVLHLVLLQLRHFVSIVVGLVQADFFGRGMARGRRSMSRTHTRLIVVLEIDAGVVDFFGSVDD